MSRLSLLGKFATESREKESLERFAALVLSWAQGVGVAAP